MSQFKSLYRDRLPQLGDRIFLADGGLETSLIFHHGLDLPLFAAFPLVASDAGSKTLRAYYQAYIDIALNHRTGIVLDTPTWRASHGWGDQLGYSVLDIQFFNETAVELLTRIRAEQATDDTPIVINGAIGPQDDGYNPSGMMTAARAEQYHNHQVETLARTRADMVTAVTMTYVDEAVGIARAAKKAGIPVAISFTTETDGRLPTGMSLREAIETTDRLTDATPVYYMINCAHPSHFDHVIDGDEAWLQRIYGIRANASRMSHAELDEAVELDDGNPAEFGREYADLRRRLHNLRVVGGCCGTDHRHVGEACQSLDAGRAQGAQRVA